MNDGGRWKARAPLKRYWEAGVWGALFDALLHVPRGEQPPSLAELARKIDEFLGASVASRQKLKQGLQSCYAVLREAGKLHQPRA